LNILPPTSQMGLSVILNPVILHEALQLSLVTKILLILHQHSIEIRTIITFWKN
jgi:hypothetical protein